MLPAVISEAMSPPHVRSRRPTNEDLSTEHGDHLDAIEVGRRLTAAGAGDHALDASAGSSKPAGVIAKEVLVQVPRRSSFGSTMEGVHLDQVDTFGGTAHVDANEVPSDSATAAYVNKLKIKQQRDLVYEIQASGVTGFRETTLRELYEYVMGCVAVTAKLPPSDRTRTSLLLRSRLSQASLMLSNGTAAAAGGGWGTGGGAEVSNVASPSVVSASTGPGESAARRRGGNGGGAEDKHPGPSFLHHRDLRQLFSANTASEPTIAVRRHVVLVNFESIRAIVLVDRVILQVPAGIDSELRAIERELLREHEEMLEFEIKAYEALLSISSLSLARELKIVEPRVKDIVALMELPGGHAATSAEANDKFRSLMNTVSEMDSRAKARRRALLNLLEEDEDLAMMQLTKMREHPENYALPLSHEVEEDHEEVELLLESFLQEITSLSNVLEGMGSRMRNTETLIQVKLDIARNQLLTASTIFSLVAMCLSFGAVITGLFGMNLNNGHMDTADSHQWFIGVAISFATICLLWGGGTFWYFNRKGIWVS